MRPQRRLKIIRPRENRKAAWCNGDTASALRLAGGRGVGAAVRTRWAWGGGQGEWEEGEAGAGLAFWEQNCHGAVAQGAKALNLDSSLFGSLDLNLTFLIILKGGMGASLLGSGEWEMQSRPWISCGFATTAWAFVLGSSSLPAVGWRGTAGIQTALPASTGPALQVRGGRLVELRGSHFSGADELNSLCSFLPSTWSGSDFLQFMPGSF